MSPRNQRKRLQALADQIRSNAPPLNDDQLAYLADVLELIGMGEDANKVLGLAYSAGRSKKDEMALENQSLIFHWMTSAMKPVDAIDELGLPDSGHGLTLEQAIDAVLCLGKGEWINPNTGEMTNYINENGVNTSPFKEYSEDTLRRLWRESSTKHMRVNETTSFEKNSPYPYK